MTLRLGAKLRPITYAGHPPCLTGSADTSSGGLSGHDQGVSTVVMHAVVSVDGFVADAGDDVGPLFEWYFNGDAEIVDGRPFAATEASLGYVRPMPLSTSSAPWLTSAAADGGG